MRLCGNCKDKLFKIGLNTLFYILLIILLLWMVYPYTSFYYRKPIVTPFAMRLNENYVVLEEGESFYLYVVGPKKKAKFSTNDFKVVDVSSGGTISARQKGRAVIKVKVGNKILKCKVKVIKKKK